MDLMEQPREPEVNHVLPPPGIEMPGGQPGPDQPSTELRDRRRPLRKAVALEYNRGGKQRAPVVTASGRGELAERIIALAQQHGVYVQPDPDLVELLSRLDLGTAIPPQLYYVVAEILAFVYKLNQAASPIPSPAKDKS
jgi:flagellar biosynthesis protein